MDSIFNVSLDAPSTKYDNYLQVEQHKRRAIYLGGIDGDSAYEVLRDIHMFNQEDRGAKDEDKIPIKIYIDSPGGSTVACAQIIDGIELSSTPIYTIATGGAYSAGGLILLSGHRRIAYAKATFMWHEGSLHASGDAGKMRNLMDFYKKEDERWVDYVVSKTKISREILKEKTHEDWWMTAPEMLDMGIVDEIAKELVI